MGLFRFDTENTPFIKALFPFVPIALPLLVYIKNKFQPNFAGEGGGVVNSKKENSEDFYSITSKNSVSCTLLVPLQLQRD